MRVSLNLTDFSWATTPRQLGARLAEVAQAVDEAGLDTLWVGDHLLQADPTAAPDGPMLEAYTTLGCLAASTTRVRLGTMVTAVSYRPAALLIKAVTTLDVLSGGRAWLGIGAGYHTDEARMMGLPLPPAGDRFELLADTLQLALHMWAGDDRPYHGHHLDLQRPVSSPATVQQPHPPILIGGMGERRTLPLVARFGDACNLFDIPDGGKTIRHKLAVLAEHCRAGGRDPDEIETTLSTRLPADEPPNAFVERCAGLGALGTDHVVVLTDGPVDDHDLTCLTTAAHALA